MPVLMHTHTHSLSRIDAATRHGCPKEKATMTRIEAMRQWSAPRTVVVQPTQSRFSLCAPLHVSQISSMDGLARWELHGDLDKGACGISTGKESMLLPLHVANFLVVNLALWSQHEIMGTSERCPNKTKDWIPRRSWAVTWKSVPF